MLVNQIKENNNNGFAHCIQIEPKKLLFLFAEFFSDGNITLYVRCLSYVCLISPNIDRLMAKVLVGRPFVS